MTAPRDALVDVVGLSKRYGSGSAAVTALNDVSLTIPEGALVALAGRSGSGKTTLLNCIGGLDKPSAGTVRVAGLEVTAMSEARRTDLRRDTIAFVFQTFGLVPMLSAFENVSLPLRLRRVSGAARDKRVAELLEQVGLGRHMHQRPGELSGGQQQRVAIARALAHEPRLLIADEPTGQLDADTGRAIMDLLRDVVASRSMTALISTHDPSLMERADAVIRLADGALALAETDGALALAQTDDALAPAQTDDALEPPIAQGGAATP